MKKIAPLLALMLSLAALLPASAQANCPVRLLADSAVRFVFKSYTPFKFESSAFAPGATLYTADTPLSAFDSPSECIEARSLGATSRMSGEVESYDAYPTNIPGIGVRFRLKGQGVDAAYQPWGYESGGLTYRPPAAAAPQVVLEMVKTGDIGSAATVSGEVRNNGSFPYVTVIGSGEIVVYPIRPACALLNPSIVLPIARASGTGDREKVDVRLLCAGTWGGNLRNLSIAILDQGPQADSGVQLFNDATPLKVGDTYAGTLHVVASGAGAYSLALAARYVASADPSPRNPSPLLETLLISYP